MTETPGCTVRISASETCGAPAVRSWTSRTGSEFHECAEHDAGPVGIPAPAPAAPRKGRFTTPQGSTIRCESSRRFFVGVEFVPGSPRVIFRTDDIFKAFDRRVRTASTAFVIDTRDGSIVRSAR